MQSLTRPLAAALIGLGVLAMPAIAAEEHGHCSGPNVCKGDTICEKQGHKEMTKEACAKIPGAKFEVSSHAGENHKDGKHDHKKK